MAFLAGLAVFAAFFFAEVVCLDDGFFAGVRDVILSALRTGDFEVALFDFGRAGFALSARPLTDDLVAGRRAGVRDVERLNPFVMGLLIYGEAFKLKDSVSPSKTLENEGKFNTAPLVNQRKKGSCGIFQPLSANRTNRWPTKKNTCRSLLAMLECSRLSKSEPHRQVCTALLARKLLSLSILPPERARIVWLIASR